MTLVVFKMSHICVFYDLLGILLRLLSQQHLGVHAGAQLFAHPPPQVCMGGGPGLQHCCEQDGAQACGHGAGHCCCV